MVGMLGFVKMYSGGNVGVSEDVQWLECWG